MDVKDWGIAISAALAAVSYWAKTRHERRRATRMALYYLLEVHHQVYRIRGVTKTGAQQFIQQIRIALEARGKTVTDAETENAGKQLQNAMHVFARLKLDELGKEIREPFAKTLAELAREDPMLAFKLNGRDKLLTLAQSIQTMTKTLAPESTAESNATGTPNFEIDNFLLDAAADDLDHALKMTAWRSDVFTNVLVHLRLRDIANGSDAGPSELIKEMAERIVGAMDSNSPQIAEVIKTQSEGQVAVAPKLPTY